RSAASGLTSGTTRGTSGSRRKALVLSMTTAPASTAARTHCRLTEPPALKKATSTPRKASSDTACTTTSSSPKRTVLPALRGEAKSRSSPTGKFRSRKSCSSSAPTAPVAPRTAMLSSFTSLPPMPAAAGAAPLPHGRQISLDQHGLELPSLQRRGHRIHDEAKLRDARGRLLVRVVLAEGHEINVLSHQEQGQVHRVAAQNVVAGHGDHDGPLVA